MFVRLIGCGDAKLYPVDHLSLPVDKNPNASTNSEPKREHLFKNVAPKRLLFCPNGKVPINQSVPLYGFRLLHIYTQQY